MKPKRHVMKIYTEVVTNYSEEFKIESYKVQIVYGRKVYDGRINYVNHSDAKKEAKRMAVRLKCKYREVRCQKL